MDEIKAFLEEQKNQENELSPEELENAAGGTCNSATCTETLLSVFSVGIGCAVLAVYTYANSGDYVEQHEDHLTIHIGGHVGQKYDNEGRLCNEG
ncbi:MAG: hypothetical protein IK093_11310 [Ruminiclostridium sp.]|nr:hypothetical protein [Ruminiclostridium sp.]